MAILIITPFIVFAYWFYKRGWGVIGLSNLSINKFLDILFLKYTSLAFKYFLHKFKSITQTMFAIVLFPLTVTTTFIKSVFLLLLNLIRFRPTPTRAKIMKEWTEKRQAKRNQWKETFKNSLSSCPSGIRFILTLCVSFIFLATYPFRLISIISFHLWNRIIGTFESTHYHFKSQKLKKRMEKEQQYESKLEKERRSRFEYEQSQEQMRKHEYDMELLREINRDWR